MTVAIERMPCPPTPESMMSRFMVVLLFFCVVAFGGLDALAARDDDRNPFVFDLFADRAADLLHVLGQGYHDADVFGLHAQSGADLLEASRAGRILAAGHAGSEVDSRWIIYTSGVVPALSAIIKALAMPGDKVIVQTPAYNCFYSSIRNDGCELFANNLVYQDGRYVIDFADLERKASDPKAKILLLCNPHNPVGRVWTPEELQHIGDICLRNEVFVVADEIHCELTYEGYDYTPFASLSERFLQNSVTCVSLSKAFNLAGLQIANIIAADEEVRRRIDRAININEVCDVNPFGVIATMAAYNEGGEWLDALRKYLRGNYEYLCCFFKERLPQYPVLPLEGTYLVWIDCRASGISSDVVALRLQEQQHLMVNSGTMYGPGGEGFIRLNIACPRALLADGLERMARLFYREVF